MPIRSRVCGIEANHVSCLVIVRRLVEFIPLLVTALAVAAIMVFVQKPQAMHARLDPEVFKLSYQFLLIVVLGSAVTLSFQAIAVGRDARDKRRSMQREIHDALVEAYNDAKHARRLLRARARTGGNGADPSVDPRLDVDEYDGQMEAVSRAQLGIELVIRRIKFNSRSFRRAKEITTHLGIVEKYLNQVIDEWEDVRVQSRRSPRLTVHSLPALDDFLRHYDHSARFRLEFKVPFASALQLLERALRAG
jgi:hypothetical protein